MCDFHVFDLPDDFGVICFMWWLNQGPRHDSAMSYYTAALKGAAKAQWNIWEIRHGQDIVIKYLIAR